MSDTISHEELGAIKLSKAKTIPQIVEYFANQYYIYGQNRSHLEAHYYSELRAAITSDAFYFDKPELEETPLLRGFNEEPRQGRYWSTKQVLNEMFDELQELSCYKVTERAIIVQVCDVVRGAYEAKERKNFKLTLAGEGKFHNW